MVWQVSKSEKSGLIKRVGGNQNKITAYFHTKAVLR